MLHQSCLPHPPADMQPGMAVEVREYQYRAATSNLDYGFARQKGVTNILCGGTGSVVFNRFTGPGRVGIRSLDVHLPAEE
jgi:uncharacterized protein (AIM24 family)